MTRNRQLTMVMTEEEFKELTDLVGDINYEEKPELLLSKAALVRRLIKQEIEQRSNKISDIEPRV